MNTNVLEFEDILQQLKNKLGEWSGLSNIKRVDLAVNGDLEVLLNYTYSPEIPETLNHQEAEILSNKHFVKFATCAINQDGFSSSCAAWNSLTDYVHDELEYIFSHRAHHGLSSRSGYQVGQTERPKNAIVRT